MMPCVLDFAISLSCQFDDSKCNLESSAAANGIHFRSTTLHYCCSTGLSAWDQTVFDGTGMWSSLCPKAAHLATWDLWHEKWGVRMGSQGTDAAAAAYLVFNIWFPLVLTKCLLELQPDMDTSRRRFFLWWIVLKTCGNCSVESFWNLCRGCFARRVDKIDVTDCDACGSNFVGPK